MARPPKRRYSTVSVMNQKAIGRAEYSWKSGKTDWQVSIEAANNFLDVESELFLLDAAGGILQPEPLDNATSRVTEKRGQANRVLWPPAIIQPYAAGSAWAANIASLKQTGASGLIREFWRPKGQVSLGMESFSPARLSARNYSARSASSISAIFYLRLICRMPTIMPAIPNWCRRKAGWPNWNLTASLARQGSIKLKLQYEKFSDIVDQIPILTGGEAPGNLPGSASRWSAETNITFLLDTIGFKGAKLDLEGYYQRSSLTDPVTGIRRRFGFDRKWTWDANFRHDIPGSKLAWGIGAEDRSDAPFLRLGYSFRQFFTKPQTFAFIEHKDIFGLKLRGTIINLIGQQEKYSEIFFADRLNNVVDQFRDGTNKYGVIGRISSQRHFLI